MRRPGIRLLARLLAPLAVVAGVALAAPAPASAAVDVPVLGSVTTAMGRDPEYVRVLTVIHGVRRITGGTALYYSVGVPTDEIGQYITGTGYVDLNTDEQYVEGSDAIYMGSQHLIDPANHQVYSALVTGQNGSALASHAAQTWPSDTPKGQLLVQYAVFPPLPADVKTVDVSVGQSDIVQAVPVSDGAMTPTQDASKPIPLGTGWPAIDQAAVTAAYQPISSIYPWVTAVSTLNNAITQRQRPKQESVDLAADVLFAVDKATLSPQAQATIKAAASQVNTAAKSGAISVIGYTDNTGTDAHNDVLSQQRAAAVAAVLKPLLTVPGLQLTVAGHGERDPVASNNTDAGRRANRRVSIEFIPKAG